MSLPNVTNLQKFTVSNRLSSNAHFCHLSSRFTHDLLDRFHAAASVTDWPTIATILTNDVHDRYAARELVQMTETSPAVLLALACAAGSLAAVQALLACVPEHADLLVNGIPVLIFAVESRREVSVEIVSHLLKAGASATRRTAEQWTPLLAVAQGASASTGPPIIRQLLRAGASVHETTPDGVTALYLAAINLQPGAALAITECLLGAGARPARTPKLGTPLHAVAMIGTDDATVGELVRVLVVAGADPAEVGEDGATALTMAARRTQEHGTATKIAQALVEAGADVNVGGTGPTPLMCAAHAGNLPLVQLLVEAGAVVTPHVPVCPPFGQCWGRVRAAQSRAGAALTDMALTVAGPDSAGQMMVTMFMSTGRFIGQIFASIGLSLLILMLPFIRFFSNIFISASTPVALAARAGHLDVVDYLNMIVKADAVIKDTMIT